MPVKTSRHSESSTIDDIVFNALHHLLGHKWRFKGTRNVKDIYLSGGDKFQKSFQSLTHNISVPVCFYIGISSECHFASSLVTQHSPQSRKPEVEAAKCPS